jgi:hypothetical protein
MNLNYILNTIIPVITLILVFYKSFTNYKLSTKNLFKLEIFRILILSLLIYSNILPPLRITILFILSLMILNSEPMVLYKENFTDTITDNNTIIDVDNDNANIDNDNAINANAIIDNDNANAIIDNDNANAIIDNDNAIIDNANIDNDNSNTIIDNTIIENDEPFVKESCDGQCKKISYTDFITRVDEDDFSQDYFNDIKDCMVVDLLQDRSKKEVRTILKRLDLTNNDIDGPIGTAYVDYDNALSRVY